MAAEEGPGTYATSHETWYNRTSLEQRQPAGTSAPSGVENSSDVIWLHAILEDFQQGLFTYGEARTVVLVAVYIVVFLLAAVGNILVLLVVLANKSMRNVTNYFLLNLAVADLLVTVVCIPLTVGEAVYKVWVYGEFLCKITSYMQGVSVTASVLTIMSLSLYRYLAVRQPVRIRRIATTGSVRLVIALVWTIAAGVMVPLAVVRGLMLHPVPHIGFTMVMCHEDWPSKQARRIYDVFLFIFIYVIPGSVVISSYTMTGCRLLLGDRELQRQDSDCHSGGHMMATRRRVARLLLVLAILFAVSWFPYHIVALYMDFSREDEAKTETTLLVLRFCLLLGHSHSAQNPIVYCTMNRGFKAGIIALLKCDRLPLFRFRRGSRRGKQTPGLRRPATGDQLYRKVPPEAALPCPHTTVGVKWSTRTLLPFESDDEDHEDIPMRDVTAHAQMIGLSPNKTSVSVMSNDDGANYQSCLEPVAKGGDAL